MLSCRQYIRRSFDFVRPTVLKQLHVRQTHFDRHSSDIVTNELQMSTKKETMLIITHSSEVKYLMDAIKTARKKLVVSEAFQMYKNVAR